MKKFFIAFFAVVLVVSTCQKTYAGDVILGLEYYKFPSEVKDEDGESNARLTFNIGVGTNIMFSDNIGVRVQTSINFPLLTLLVDALSDDEDTNTDMGIGWAVAAGPVFRIPVGQDFAIEFSVLLQNFLAGNYFPTGKYRGGTDSFALGGEFVYRTNVGSMNGSIGGFSFGIAYFKIFNEYFFRSKERYTGFNKGFIIRPMFIYSLRF